MAVNIFNNKKQSVVVHVSSTNTSISIAGDPITSNIALPNENLTGGYITQVFWGCGGDGIAKISRGGTLVATFDSSGYYDYAGSGMPLSVNQTANIDITFTTADQYLMFEIQKTGVVNTGSEYFSEFIQP